MRLIDADALMVICKVREYDLFLKNVTPESWAKAYTAFREEIERMPTIEAKPVRHGKWEYHLMPLAKKCSLCGERVVGKSTWIFFPNCGAKMV